MENKAEKGIEFSTAVYEHFLREIYDGFDTSNDIEPQAWKEALRLMNEATVEGVSESKTTTHDKRFLGNLRHSNEVFTAFKVHSMGVKMAERLYDSKGNLRSFAEFQKAVAPIASHQVGSWLRTEYNTAVRRAHLASDWQEFEANKDIFPNIRWMPTTSPNAEGSHRIYWERKLTLPINDPFWAKHHPGDRWNCKCSLEATDAPSTAPPDEREAPKPQRGLDRNPKDGQLFSDKHPYFPKDCASCFAYKQSKGARNLLRQWFENRQKNCYDCPFVDACVVEAKLGKKFPKKQWEYTIIGKDGGYLVTDKERIKQGQRNSQEKKKFEKERSMGIVGAKNGLQIVHNKEKDGIYDALIDGKPAEFKSFKGAGALVEQMKHAFTKQGAETVLVRLENRKQKLMDKLLEARRKYKGRILYYYEEDGIVHELYYTP